MIYRHLKSIKQHQKKTLLATLLVSSTLFSCMENNTFSDKNLPNIDEAKTKYKETLYKNSRVSYFGSKSIEKERLIKEAKLIDLADRRFETKWLNKDPKGISEEYTTEKAVFLKPGVKPRLGRKEIEKEFANSVKSIDKVEFFQDELEFFGDLDVAFQRCHMLAYVNPNPNPVFEGSYVILWKKENNNWLIQYDMFNSDK